MAETALLWLRNDLRLSDNPALDAALRDGRPVVAVYVEETDPNLRPRGATSRWWLHHSLKALAADLAKLGIRLSTHTGALLDAPDIAEARVVFWNKRYAPAEREIDDATEAALGKRRIAVRILPGNVLVDPSEITTKTGTPYAVYTPFWNTLRGRDIGSPQRASTGRRDPIPVPRVDGGYRTPEWAKKLETCWAVGEAVAQARLGDFLDRVTDYPVGRDVPAKEATSKLSPHLAHGEISARQIWHAAQAVSHRSPARAAAIEKFLMELAWRDFNFHQLYHRADIANVPMQPKFMKLNWRQSDADLRAWQRGETGIPIVDAGMRELWETGFMQNRVRMLAASLLTKNLLLDWRLGEQWFWDTLVDADPANNAANWQWVAGCGNDAAPYFRIFNPVTQAGKFDPNGTYISRWAPQARVPIVDLASSRQRALDAFKALASS